MIRPISTKRVCAWVGGKHKKRRGVSKPVVQQLARYQHRHRHAAASRQASQGRQFRHRPPGSTATAARRHPAPLDTKTEREKKNPGHRSAALLGPALACTAGGKMPPAMLKEGPAAQSSASRGLFFLFCLVQRRRRADRVAALFRRARGSGQGSGAGTNHGYAGEII